MDNATVRTLLPSFLSISYRSQERIIVFRWLCPVPSEDLFRASYFALLDLAVQHDCWQWLLDLRRRGSNTVEQDQWVLHEFCPMLNAVFPNNQLVYAAYLVAPSSLHHYANVVTPALSNPLKTCYRAAAFIDEGPANSWLTDQRAAK
ncbi:hypothetical protein [Hymenobacter segetis]|uniref:STAS/SEC14 domain-containing protein n=2 Tax=Hymenobacter segetis TaxID=2025509 RepID=A0ABU9LZ33_9BACT